VQKLQEEMGFLLQLLTSSQKAPGVKCADDARTDADHSADTSSIWTVKNTFLEFVDGGCSYDLRRVKTAPSGQWQQKAKPDEQMKQLDELNKLTRQVLPSRLDLERESADQQHSHGDRTPGSLVSANLSLDELTAFSEDCPSLASRCTSFASVASPSLSSEPLLTDLQGRGGIAALRRHDEECGGESPAEVVFHRGAQPLVADVEEAPLPLREEARPSLMSGVESPSAADTEPSRRETMGSSLYEEQALPFSGLLKQALAAAAASRSRTKARPISTLEADAAAGIGNKLMALEPSVFSEGQSWKQAPSSPAVPPTRLASCIFSPAKDEATQAESAGSARKRRRCVDVEEYLNWSPESN